jgi:hypothetical protein
MKDKGLFRVVSVALTGVLLSCAIIARAQTPPSRSVVFSEVVKLSQAHQSDDVILGYLKNSGAVYTLSADEIIYLNNQGVSQRVIAALQSQPGVPTAPIVPTAPTAPPAPATTFVPPSAKVPPSPDAPGMPAGTPTYNTFHDQLAPDGTWIDVPGYGACWRPSVLVANPDWRPYYDGGHWVYTDNGWYWQSDYAWGGVVFHYGRWTLNSRYGWVWIPGYDWGPSWVCWRHADGYCGWAPLPPEARFQVGVGLTFNGHIGAGVDFGLGIGVFTFVAYDHFWERDFRRYVVPHDRVVVAFRGSRPVNDFRVVNGRFYNEGIGHERVAIYTHHDVRVETVVVHDHYDNRDHGFHDDRGRYDSRNDHGRYDNRGHDHP